MCTPHPIINFMPAAIYQVKPLGIEPIITVQRYGETQPNARF
jgi:hypothetical protein